MIFAILSLCLELAEKKKCRGKCGIGGNYGRISNKRNDY